MSISNLFKENDYIIKGHQFFDKDGIIISATQTQLNNLGNITNGRVYKDTIDTTHNLRSINANTHLTVATDPDEITLDVDINQNLDLNNFKVINQANPNDPQDGATKDYVDTRELNNLQDVNTSALVNGQVLTYNSGIWTNATPGADINIYNNDGTMNGTRVIDGNNYVLLWQNQSNITLNANTLMQLQAGTNSILMNTGLTSLTGNTQIIGELDMLNNKIVNVDTPISADDAANKDYVDTRNINDLNDVNISAVQDNDIIYYDSLAAQWKNKQDDNWKFRTTFASSYTYIENLYLYPGFPCSINIPTQTKNGVKAGFRCNANQITITLNNSFYTSTTVYNGGATITSGDTVGGVLELIYNKDVATLVNFWTIKNIQGKWYANGTLFMDVRGINDYRDFLTTSPQNYDILRYNAGNYVNSPLLNVGGFNQLYKNDFTFRTLRSTGSNINILQNTNSLDFSFSPQAGDYTISQITNNSVLASTANVNIVSPLNDQHLMYNSTTLKWENKTYTGPAVTTIYTGNGSITQNRTIDFDLNNLYSMSFNNFGGLNFGGITSSAQIRNLAPATADTHAPTLGQVKSTIQNLVTSCITLGTPSNVTVPKFIALDGSMDASYDKAQRVVVGTPSYSYICKELTFNVVSPPGLGNSITATLYKNGVATALVATISNLSFQGSNIINTVTFLGGETWAVFITDTSGTRSPLTCAVNFVRTA